MKECLGHMAVMCVCFPDSFIIVTRLVNIVYFRKEKKKKKLPYAEQRRN